MSRDAASGERRDLAGLVHAVADDVGRLLGQHADLARAELHDGLGRVPAAAAAIGAGAGLVAAGGALGTLMLVHGLHRATRLPLWGCYGLVGGALAAAGCGLIAAGTRHAAGIRLVPRETIAALREDVAWLKDQVAGPVGSA
jgi:Putative Actinobacterial Holin-X, holin superfamily III